MLGGFGMPWNVAKPTEKELLRRVKYRSEQLLAAEKRVIEEAVGPVLLGVDVGLAEGDYTVEMRVRIDENGVVRVISMRAEPGAPRPDPGTDTTDNGLQGT